MKIAVFHNLAFGGAKRAAYELVKRLSAKHTIDLFRFQTAHEGDLSLEPFCRKVFVFQLPTKKWSARRIFSRSSWEAKVSLTGANKEISRQLARQIDEGGYDVAFVHNCQYLQSPAVLIYFKTPSVYLCQEPFRVVYESLPIFPSSDEPWLSRAKAALKRPGRNLTLNRVKETDRNAARSASLVLVNSYYSLESFYKAYGVYPRVCYLGVDADKFRPLSLPKEDIVLAVGPLSLLKGHDFIVESLGTIASLLRPKLVVAHGGTAGGAVLDHIKSLAEKQGVEISFLGKQSEEDLVTWYNRAKVVAYAPIMEPFGLVPLEAMACETAVVGVREGGVRESIIDGQTGILANRDAQEFGKAIQDLMENDEKRIALGKAGREQVLKSWTWDASADRVEQHLVRAAEGKHFRPWQPPGSKRSGG